MSDLFVECPVCEDTVDLTSSSSQSIVCPTCRRPIDLKKTPPIRRQAITRSEILPQPTSKATPGNATPESLVSFKTTQRNEEPSATIPVDTSTEHQASMPPKLAGQDGFKIRAGARTLKKHRNEKIVFALVVLATLFGIAFGIVFLRLQMEDYDDVAASNAPTSLNESTDAPTSVANSKLTETSTDLEGDNDDSSLTDADLGTEPEPPFEMPPEAFSYFAKQQVEECWRIIRPHIVSLEIENQYGKKQAAATIVDSRGWILTSYQAIKDAWQIEVTAATAELDLKGDKKPLVDLARGIIAVDEAHDLAILSVNRRFVVSFSDLVVSEKNLLVPGEYLLQSGAPSRQNPHGKSEVQIKSRRNFEELDPDFQAKIRSTQSDESETDAPLQTANNSWLNLNGGELAVPGMPLFQIDGQMVGMIVFSNKKVSEALPVHHVRKLIESASGTATPFERPQARNKSGNVVNVDSGSEARKLTVKLNQAGQACEQFLWLATDRQQYAALQEFSRQLSASIDFTRDSDDEAGSELVQQQLEIWGEKLGNQLGRVIHNEPERLTKLNQFAASEIKKGDKNSVVFFGSLYIGGIESPKLILKFDEMETFVNAPFNPEDPPMMPDSNWLFFVETPSLARPLKINHPFEGAIPTHSATILYAIGPIKK
jgi:hypothetical protein